MLFLRFPSERQPRSCSSRKPFEKTNDGNHKNTFLATTETIEKPTTETIKKSVSCHDGNHFKKKKKKQRRKPVLNTQTTTRNRSIHSKIMDSPAAAESTKNPGTETMKRTSFPATTETIKRKKTTTETIKINVSCDDGNHQRKKKKNNDGNHSKEKC